MTRPALEAGQKWKRGDGEIVELKDCNSVSLEAGGWNYPKPVRNTHSQNSHSPYHPWGLTLMKDLELIELIEPNPEAPKPFDLSQYKNTVSLIVRRSGYKDWVKILGGETDHTIAVGFGPYTRHFSLDGKSVEGLELLDIVDIEESFVILPHVTGLALAMEQLAGESKEPEKSEGDEPMESDNEPMKIHFLGRIASTDSSETHREYGDRIEKTIHLHNEGIVFALETYIRNETLVIEYSIAPSGDADEENDGGKGD